MKSLTRASAPLLLAAALLSGCSSVPIADGQRDAEAKAFLVNPQRANVYVFRNQGLAPGLATGLEVNGQSVGKLGVRTYMVLPLKPGKYALAAHAENDAGLDLVVAAGQNYYVWQEMKGGTGGQAELHLVNPGVGSSGVREGRLTESPNTVAAVAAVEPVLLVDPNAPPRYEIQTVEFRPGISSFTVESLAKRRGCVGGQGAGLITDKGPVEVYRMQCDNGKVFMAKCELRQCKPLR